LFFEDIYNPRESDRPIYTDVRSALVDIRNTSSLPDYKYKHQMYKEDLVHMELCFLRNEVEHLEHENKILHKQIHQYRKERPPPHSTSI